MVLFFLFILSYSLFCNLSSLAFLRFLAYFAHFYKSSNTISRCRRASSAWKKKIPLFLSRYQYAYSLEMFSKKLNQIHQIYITVDLPRQLQILLGTYFQICIVQKVFPSLYTSVNAVLTLCCAPRLMSRHRLEKLRRNQVLENEFQRVDHSVYLPFSCALSSMRQ